MDYLSVDRFEGEFVVCVDENCKTINLKKSELPKNLKEGDLLVQKNGEYVIDYEQTIKKREKAAKLQDDLFGEGD